MCFWNEARAQAVCVVRRMDQLCIQGTTIRSPYDCELLTMSNDTHAVHSTSILRATSIVHECSPSCNFMYTPHSVQQERENVTVNKLTFVHDYSNTTYSLNSFCMSS